MKRFAEISKVEENDDGTIDVHGIASTEARDVDGETVTKGAMEAAFPDYFKHGDTGPLRAMHQPIAAGYVYKAEVNAAGETEISAKVVDPVEILKVKTGVYKGFSIGGKKLPGGYDAKTKTITKMRLTEISLVDRPANPEAVITMFKGDDIGDETEIDVSAEAAETVAAVVEHVNKGAITPARVLELVNEEIAKAAPPAFVEDKIKAKKKEGKDGESDEESDEAEGDDKKKKKDPPAAKEDEKAEKSEGADDIKKNMYDLSTFSDILSRVSSLASCSEYEAQYEGDASVVPQQLRDWLKDGVAIFQGMAAEETAEMLAQLQPKVKSTGVIALADTSLDIAKCMTGSGATVDSFIKAATPYASREDISKALFDDAGVIGENMKALAETVVAKAAIDNTDAATKLSDAIAKAAAFESNLRKVTEERDGLIAKVAQLEKQPAASKVTLRVAVNKGDDIIQENEKAAEETIVKRADGSIDGEATAKAQIMKIHQSGGQRGLR